VRELFLSAVTLCLAASASLPVRAQSEDEAAIPLPEHPDPSFERSEWLNLNGAWDFRFDPEGVGSDEGWQSSREGFDARILVPFPWGSPLSGVEDEADIGWYARSIEVPAEWAGRRVFLNVGAADWHTTAWLDGERLGEHQGGYTPFSFELTPHLKAGGTHHLVLRVDDAPREFRLHGKQGYGNARGIWQTPFLEARGDAPLQSLHLAPDLGGSKVQVTASLLEEAPADLSLRLEFRTGGLPPVEQTIPAGESVLRFDVAVPEPHLWSLEDPFLYELDAYVEGGGLKADRVSTYFGMREISVVDLPGTEIPYVALNGEPVYLQLALDQAYHPDGFYTFPSDDFVRDEVLRSRQIGLNGQRVHVKVPLPRKLYWADRLGMLIMADVPNSWGEPTAEMRQEVEYALRGMIRRDFNHPSIFSWIPFNETWGLFTRVAQEGEEEPKRVYEPETQRWVASVVALAKELDPTRLVEDNSVCCSIGHTETDINSWHAYLPGWAWKDHLAEISEGTYPGSEWNFEDGYAQARQPNINSEFGNVWGYEGSTGDVDWSWDYHLAVDAFRRNPKIAGWLYTEHHDVVNEWNGYWRYDRSTKETGLGDLVEGMSLRDLHTPLYVSVGDAAEMSRSAQPGETIEVPLWASFLTGSRPAGEELTLSARLYGWDALGRARTWWTGGRTVDFQPWISQALEPLSVTMPEEPAVLVLGLSLADGAGTVLHRNFTTFVVENEGVASGEVTLEDGRKARLLSVAPESFSSGKWSLRQWDVLDGLKVNGAGSGHFSYRIAWPEDVGSSDVEYATFVFEASAKQLFGKDRKSEKQIEGDFMLGRGTLDPSLNPNAYPMTDETSFPSAVTVRVNGVVAGRRELPDDPADHRGILSWHSQLRDRRLREAGSYGYRIAVPIPRTALERAAGSGELELRLEVDEALPGGLAIYGRRFGRYPLDPTLVLALSE